MWSPNDVKSQVICKFEIMSFESGLEIVNEPAKSISSGNHAYHRSIEVPGLAAVRKDRAHILVVLEDGGRPTRGSLRRMPTA